MIGILEVLSGYATKLDRLKLPIEFKPGLNILFGPNGCGKSTTLKIAAAYCSVNGAGWSSIQRPGISKKTYPDCFSELSPGKCKAKLEWDGSPTLLADASVSDQTTFTHFFYDTKDSPDGMTGMNDQLGMIFGKPSSGMIRLTKLKQYMDALKNPPDLTQVPKVWKKYNNLWINAAKKQSEHFAGLPRGGPVTFMMDEPDRSLSIENQMLFWTNLIPQVKSRYQVIVATHCPFALIHTDAHWIDFDPEYRTKSLAALKKLQPILE